MARIVVGDCLEVMPTLDACSVDAIVTDPPYHLTNKGGGPHGSGLNNAYGRARAGANSTGFMGKAWDGGDIAHDPAVWREALRAAKPGAHLLAFGGTRTHHRLMCAIEDAGWEIRDTLGWIFGSGFPKSHNGSWGGTALKPAWEPIILARKPLGGTVAANVQQHGTGALNIDACRVETGERITNHARTSAAAKSKGIYGDSSQQETHQTAGQILGRWPANILHDGSDEVVAVFPQSHGQAGAVTGNELSSPFRNAYGDMARSVASQPRGDAGSAARFFYCAKASAEDRNEGCGGLPTKGPRENHHPTVKPTNLMRYLCRLITPPGGLILDPFAGSGSTGKAALLEGFRFMGIELSTEYASIARARIYATTPLFTEVA